MDVPSDSYIRVMNSMKMALLSGLVACAMALSACSRSYMKVETPQPGAAVFVNDSAVGTTPWTGLIDKGPARMLVEHNGTVLQDTAFLANSNGQYLWSGLFYGGFTVAMVGYYGFGSAPLLFLGGSVEMGTAFFGRSLMIDHKLSAQDQPAPAARTRPFLHGTGRQILQLQGKTARADTLIRTDSLCYESRRQTVWTHDAQKNRHLPVSASALSRCQPGTHTQWKSDPVLPYLLGGAAIGATTLGLITTSLSNESNGSETSPLQKFQIGAIWGAPIGALMGLYTWNLAPEHERCDELQDSVAFRKWLEEYPCQGEPLAPKEIAPASAAKPTSEPTTTPAAESVVEPTVEPVAEQAPPAITPALPGNIRVIQFPTQSDSLTSP